MRLAAEIEAQTIANHNAGHTEHPRKPNNYGP